MSKPPPAPLNGCVRQALERYFAELSDDAPPPSDLYALLLREMERPLLELVLRYTGGNQSRAAQLLGLNRGTLRKKLRHYRLDG